MIIEGKKNFFFVAKGAVVHSATRSSFSVVTGCGWEDKRTGERKEGLRSGWCDLEDFAHEFFESKRALCKKRRIIRGAMVVTLV